MTTIPTPLAGANQAADWVFKNGVSYARLQVGPANLIAPGNYRVYVSASGYTVLAPALLAAVA